MGLALNRLGIQLPYVQVRACPPNPILLQLDPAPSVPRNCRRWPHLNGPRQGWIAVGTPLRRGICPISEQIILVAACWRMRKRCTSLAAASGGSLRDDATSRRMLAGVIAPAQAEAGATSELGRTRCCPAWRERPWREPIAPLRSLWCPLSRSQ